jgi:hypothetical protein
MNIFERGELGLRLLLGLRRELLAQGQLHDRLVVAAPKEGDHAAKKRRGQTEQNPHGATFCTVSRRGTSLNLNAGQGYDRLLGGLETGGEKRRDFATYRH